MAPRGLARDLGEIDGLVAHLELAAVHAREIEEIADEPFEATRLDRDRPGSLVRLEGAVGQALRVAADRGQRRLELMAHREQEVALGLARGGELLSSSR